MKEQKYIENLEDALVDTQKNIEKTYKRARTQYRKMHKMEMQAIFKNENVSDNAQYVKAKNKYDKFIKEAQGLEKVANKTEEELKELSPQVIVTGKQIGRAHV